ncbi:hypothetical protein GQ53DRAFT_831892 [Thozetella sp. PMI_491]|nr:hypothetical protein GQ53DRAFT_831892 [Thozetella sp. PMI_491]
MSHRQRTVSPETAALETYNVRIAEQFSSIQSQYHEQEEGAQDHFDRDTAQTRAEIRSFQQEIARIQAQVQMREEKLQQLQADFDIDKQQRAQTYRARLRDNLSFASEYAVSPSEAPRHPIPLNPSQKKIASERDHTRNSSEGRGAGHSSTTLATRVPGHDNAELHDEDSRDGSGDEEDMQCDSPHSSNSSSLSPPPLISMSSSRHAAYMSKNLPSGQHSQILGDKRPRPDDTGAARASKKRKQADTIDFHDVFRGGQATQKYTIVEFPEGADRWYILRCEPCSLYFRNRPLMGAVKHLLSSRHSGGSGCRVTYDMAIKKLGIRVLCCTAELAKRNNHVFDESLEVPVGIGERPPSSGTTRTTRSHSGAGGHKSTRDLHAGDGTDRRHQDANPEPGRDPAVGEIYFARDRRTNQWCPAVVLPTDRFEEIGMTGSIADTDLVNSIPKCYNSRGKHILGWARKPTGGVDGASIRRFPVLYLDDSMDIPLHGKFQIPGASRSGITFCEEFLSKA